MPKTIYKIKYWINSVVIEILSFRQKTLLLYIIGYLYFLKPAFKKHIRPWPNQSFVLTSSFLAYDSTRTDLLMVGWTAFSDSDPLQPKFSLFLSPTPANIWKMILVGILTQNSYWAWILISKMVVFFFCVKPMWVD